MKVDQKRWEPVIIDKNNKNPVAQKSTITCFFFDSKKVVVAAIITAAIDNP